MSDKTYEMWVDVLGQPYGPGDRIAFARPYSQGSALIDTGIVERINKVDSNGNDLGRYIRGAESESVWEPAPTITVRPEGIGISVSQYGRSKNGQIKLMTVRNPRNVLRITQVLDMSGAAERVLEFFSTLEKTDDLQP